MAFVNELIPKANKLETDAIFGPMQQPVLSSMWTVDQDKNAYLIRTGQDRDAQDLVYFFCLYRMRVKQKITAHKCGNSYLYKLAYAVSDFTATSGIDVKETLKEALSVFAGMYGAMKPIAVEFEF
jgi:hypothetical protein